MRTILAGFMSLAGMSLWVVAQAQTPADGKTLFERRCGGCHALDRDKEGPRLGDAYGRRAGSVPSFQYSDALKKSGIRWNEASLDQWLTDTEKLVPDTDMIYHVKSAAERSAIIAYLRKSSKATTSGDAVH